MMRVNFFPPISPKAFSLKILLSRWIKTVSASLSVSPSARDEPHESTSRSASVASTVEILLLSNSVIGPGWTMSPALLTVCQLRGLRQLMRYYVKSQLRRRSVHLERRQQARHGRQLQRRVRARHWYSLNGLSFFC